MTEENKKTTAFDKGINLKMAYERVIESLTAAESCRQETADTGINWTFEELWYQQQAARYAVSTADTTQASNYYDPQLFAAIKRLTDRTSKGVFSGGQYFELEPVNVKDEVDSRAANVGELILEDQLHKAKFKTFAKSLIETAGFVDCAIGKIVPNTDTKPKKGRVPRVPGNPSAGYDEVTKDTSKHAVTFGEVDILKFYIEDLFVDSLDDTNVIELVPSTMGYLKKMARKNVFGNLDKIEVSATASQYVVDNFKTLDGESKDKNSNKTVKNLLLAEYWGILNVNGEERDVQIVLAGDQVIRAKFVDFWYGNKPYVIHTYEKVKGLVTGYAPSRRLLPSQFALNQAYNLEIENGLLKGSGALLTEERTGAYIRKQVPGGRWKRGQIVSVKTTGNRSLKDSIMGVPFADVTSVCENIIDRVSNTMSVVLSSPISFSGQPTGTQLDRTKSGYATAIGEANITGEQMIYATQDELIEPSITFCYGYLQQFLTEDQTLKTASGNWETFSPADIYGLVHVRVFGGSKYLERQEQSEAYRDSIEMLKGAPNLAEDIDFGILYTEYLTLKGIPDAQKIIREKSAEEVFGELLKKAPPAQIQEWADMAAEQEKELKMKKMVDQDNYEKNRQINTFRIDESYEDVQKEASKRGV